jgi:hypothetical protein
VDAKFATALRYPGGDLAESAQDSGLKLTVIGPPRELARVPFEKVLPPAA